MRPEITLPFLKSRQWACCGRFARSISVQDQNSVRAVPFVVGRLLAGDGLRIQPLYQRGEYAGLGPGQAVAAGEVPTAKMGGILPEAELDQQTRGRQACVCRQPIECGQQADRAVLDKSQHVLMRFGAEQAFLADGGETGSVQLAETGDSAVLAQDMGLDGAGGCTGIRAGQ